MGAEEIIRSLAALLFVLGLIGGLVVLVRRVPLASWWIGAGGAARGAGARETRVLHILEQRRLGPRHQLVRLRWADEERLLLLGPHGDLDLGRRPAAPAPSPVAEEGR